jgi:homoserine kinase
VVCVPATRALTEVARGLLPATVAHRDAAANAGRAALLVHALTTDPTLLLPATRDWLHQRYRAPAMPASVALVDRLRDAGTPAVVSGAGPTVLAFGAAEPVVAVAGPEFAVRAVAVSAVGAAFAVRFRQSESS